MENITNTPEVDPLSEAAEGVDTSYPVLEGNRILQFRIADAKVGPTKDTTDRNLAKGDPDYREVLTLKLKTTVVARDTKGNEVQPGYAIMHRIGITPTQGRTEGTREVKPRTMDNIKRDLSTLIQAAGLKGTIRSFLDDPTKLHEALVDATVSINKATAQFPESNSVRFRLPA